MKVVDNSCDAPTPFYLVFDGLHMNLSGYEISLKSLYSGSKSVYQCIPEYQFQAHLDVSKTGHGC